MKDALRLAAKDLRLELRARELLASGLLTGVLSVAVGALALGSAPDRGAVGAGILWLALVFASSLLLARSFSHEVDRRTLDTLLLLPVDRGSIWAGKAVANGVVLAVLAALLVPATALFLGTSLMPSVALACVLALGLAGLAVAGSLLAAVSSRTRAREILLPVLLVPVALPTLLAALPATERAFEGASVADLAGPLSLLAGYDVALAAVSWILFEFAVEA